MSETALVAEGIGKKLKDHIAEPVLAERDKMIKSISDWWAVKVEVEPIEVSEICSEYNSRKSRIAKFRRSVQKTSLPTMTITVEHD